MSTKSVHGATLIWLFWSKFWWGKDTQCTYNL